MTHVFGIPFMTIIPAVVFLGSKQLLFVFGEPLMNDFRRARGKIIVNDFRLPTRPWEYASRGNFDQSPTMGRSITEIEGCLGIQLFEEIM